MSFILVLLALYRKQLKRADAKNNSTGNLERLKSTLTEQKQHFFYLTFEDG
jgi:hypothetical protein